MTTSTATPPAALQAGSYAASVRAHLDDLSAEVIEELTGGLEADLLDQAHESAEPLSGRLGDPAAYAAELRRSAGLAPRTVPRGPGRALVATVRSALDQLRSTSSWQRGAAIAHDLRPAWWVVRAWVVWQVLAPGQQLFVPRSPVGVLALAGSIVASVALGRGWGAGWRPMGMIRPVVNVLAAVLLLPMVNSANEAYQWSLATAVGGPSEAPAAPGIVVNGKTVSNVFPYGPDGAPLQGVTLLDQNGEPIPVVSDDLDVTIDPDGRYRTSVPNWTVDGDLRWNTFPLGSAAFPDDDWPYERTLRPLEPGSDYEPAAPPRLRVPAVLVDPTDLLTPPVPPSGAPSTPGPTTSSVPTPSASPTPAVPTTPASPLSPNRPS